MGRALDTCTLSDILRGRPEVLLKYKRFEGQCCTTAIALAEAYRGVDRPRKGSTPPANAEQFYDWVAGAMPVLPFDIRAARTYGKCEACLPDGITIGWPDVAIAAIVLAQDDAHVLVTSNSGHFQHFCTLGLMIENWRAT